LKSISDIFPVRRCRVNLDKHPRSTPCLNYHLKKCSCPCCGYVDREEYAEMVRQVILFLRGQSSTLLEVVEEEMKNEARRQNYERAIELRERYRAIEHLLAEQKITTMAGENEDILGVSFEDNTYAFTVMRKRKGMIIGKNDYTVHDRVGLGDVLEQFLLLFYEDSADLPDSILLPFNTGATTNLEAYFHRRFQRHIRIYSPQKGMKRRLVEMACRNAEQYRREEIFRIEPSRALRELQSVLSLRSEPRVIEAFDIATMLGSFSVASMIRFTGGKPDKKQYRKYRIRYVDEQNDVEMIREAVARRYQRLLNEGEPLPDLVLVDGGRQQVDGAHDILDGLGLGEMPLIGLAKRYEDIYRPDNDEPLRLEKRNEALRLLMAMRNEAHRFANTYHISLRSKDALLTKLKTLPGIGDVLADAILRALQDADTVTLEVLASVRGLGEKKAGLVYALLKEEQAGLQS
jgi:excinuclease ABC subunit C